MAGLIRKLREDGKFKRTVAAWLGVCIVVQMVAGSFGAVKTYADDTIYQVITVKESDIIKGVKRAAGKDQEHVPTIKKKYLPYSSNELKDDAIDKMTPFLMGTAIVKQDTLKNNCSYIVAVSGEELPASGSEVRYAAEDVVFIGLNGNKDRDCVFTLQIVDAQDIVIRSMTIITYRQDGSAATSSEATGSEATPSEESEEPATPSAATSSEATSSEATGSELPGYGFVEAGNREELSEDELADLVQTGETATPGEAGTPDGPVDPKDAAGPKMRVPAGGFAVAYAESSTNARGKVAQINAFIAEGEESIKSGAVGTFHIAADYSVIDDKLPDYAYFTVEFEVKDENGNEYNNYMGPESESTAKPISSLSSEKQREWKEINGLMAESDEYEEAAGYDDWQMITAETNTYFYSRTAGLAVFGIKNGGTAITDLPMFFSFDNYVTRIGSTITATPGILNKEELKNAYESSAGPAHSGETALIIGDEATLTSEAEFWWQNVEQSSTGKIGNMAAGTTDGEIVFKTSAKKDYQSDMGRLYTTDYTITDTITFEGFTLNVFGYGMSTDTNSKIGELYLTKDGKNVVKLIGLQLPGGYKAGRVEVTPIYRDGDSQSGIITGFEVKYTRDNASLDGGSPADMADVAKEQMNVYLGLGSILSKVKNIVEYDSDAAAAGKNPSVTSRVEFEAHSIMYDKTSGGSGIQINDGETNHYSEAAVTLTAGTDYSLAKAAYTDKDCTNAATGNSKIFEPGAKVYYKITVKNNGYSDEKFDIVDKLPDGLVPASVKTVKVTSAGIEITAADNRFTDEAAVETEDYAVKTWGNILIPSGQQAVVIFEAEFKGKGEFSDKNISTTQTNNAKWYRSSDTGRNTVLGNGDATVYVNLNTLTAQDVEFAKTIVPASGDTAKSVPAVGSDVTYKLHAELTKGVQNSHWITVRDNWPDGVTLKEISNIPSQAIVVIKDKTGGTVLKRYENTGGNTAAWSNITGLDNKSVTVEARVYLSPSSPEANLTLKGTINTEGEIKNEAQAEGGEGGGWTKPDDQTFYAIGAAIEKKAYYISASQAGSITEANSRNHPVDQSVTFRTGDVVCYEMTLKNTGRDTFTATVKDDISELFGAGITPELAAAKLDEEGSVFMREPGTKEWKKMNLSQNGTVLEKEVELQKDQETVFRIYIEIPGNDPENGETVKLRPVNTVSASLTYTNQPRHTIEAEATITINQDVQEASIDKEVYAVARELEQKNGRVYLKGARWNNSRLGTQGRGYVPDESILKVGTGDYVFYRITINNESEEEALRIHEIEDWLPEGMKFVRFYEFNGQGNNEKQRIPGETGGTEGDTLDLGVSHWSEPLTGSGANWLYYTDATAGNWQNAAAAVGHGNAHKVINGTTYRARLYNQNVNTSSKDIAAIPAGKSIAYGIIAQVTGDFESGVILENTTGVVVDKSAGTDERNDESVKNLSGSVGGRSYSDDLYKITTDTAKVITTGIYTPGIEKDLAQYNSRGTWTDYKKDGKNENFLPNYPMRWKVTLNNGTNSYMTRGPIENYTMKDTFPTGLTYNGDDADGNYIVSTGGKKVMLPKPLMGVGENGNVTASWTVEKQDGGYTVTGEDGAVITTKENLSIPARGKLTVQIGTRAAGDGTAKYGTYVNQADLIPSDEYEFMEACAGTVVRDDGGVPAAVHAEASVDIFFGDGRTEAWKEIDGSFNGVKGSGDGRDSSGNSIIADAGSEVVYTLNIKNHVEKGIKNLVIVDRLPAVKDNGIVNNMQRNSDFKVSFTSHPEIRVQVEKEDGTSAALKQSDYKVTYTDWNSKFGKGSALPAEYWEKGHSGGWENSSAGNDTFRLEVEDEALKGLSNNDTIVVTYHAQLPEADELDLTNELIAWNTFGYAYMAVESLNHSTITVEPAKVGVQIPTASLAVTKKVESRFEEDKNSRFTFILETRDGKGSGEWKSAGVMSYQITSEASENTAAGKTAADGGFTLADGETAKFTVLAGHSYRVREKNADGYYVTVTDFDGTTWEGTGDKSSLLFNPDTPPAAVLDKAVSGKNYYCSFTNARSSFFLPETGGAGTDMFRRKGAGMMFLSLLMLAGCFTGNPTGKRRKKEQ